MEASTIKVKIKTMQAEIYELEVNKTIEISDFKSEIEKVSSIEKNAMRLAYKGKQLKDGETLDKFVKQDNEVVHLIKGTPQLPPNPAPADQQNAQSQPTQPQPQPQPNQGNQPQGNANNLFQSPLFNMFQQATGMTGINIGPIGVDLSQ